MTTGREGMEMSKTALDPYYISKASSLFKLEKNALFYT